MKKEDYLYGMNWIGQMQEAYSHSTRYPTVEYALNFFRTASGMICHAEVSSRNHEGMWYTRYHASTRI